ncbi:aminotransferase class V-fold PLP-dependent enzyme [Caulobacter endophyticus]|uniref:aminotransferase class V-fold PLP-dependent enzyme n=1 Tax=Caulobacter endophyticus TaxID=2172652 RepID=UPI0024105351|nr:aminotransferase class V-fold PLP-dependent enzyme [Caulobacter endophyticus]MDG2529234.1 aminotransferase class V-fold PLP-dependent enzyme [Caulobacter endophyticus]
MDRRGFLFGASLAAAAAPALAQEAADQPPMTAPGPSPAPDWDAVKAQFQTAPDQVNMNAMLIASHPKPVRAAIDQFRRELDWRPVTFLEDNNRRLQGYSRAAAARYLGVEARQVALTDSTTMGAALVYSGLKLRPGDEILTTHQDYYVTHESLRHAALRNGASIRRISLYDDIGQVSEPQMVGRLMSAITPRTRVLALTWVHSSTGLKIPLPAISAALAGVNAGRQEADQVLLVVDGVHGFGNQDADMKTLGCDVFVAGCHKWLFGPRGTGVIAANAKGWAALRPTIPSFVDSGAWSAWINDGPLPEAADGVLMSPGGFKAFEHVWAIPAAVDFHEKIGRAQVADRTALLADQLKAGLALMPGVRLVTPRDRRLSAGITSFDVAGLSADGAVRALRQQGVVASAAPYAVQHVRLTPSLMNSPAEVDRALAAVREIARA